MSDIFDRELLFERRRRAFVRQGGGDLPDFLLARAVDDVIDRLGFIQRRFENAVSIGSYHGLAGRALRAAGIANVVETEAVDALLSACDGDRVACDEEVVEAVQGAPFDLAVSVLALQYANDLPGALARIRGLLKPDGLFIGVILGGATLGELRQAMLQAEADVRGGASPRVMPFVEVRDAGGLLQRAGFALPVTDVDSITVTYANALELVRELKAMGATNVLRERSRVPMTRGLLMRLAEIYQERFGDPQSGRVPATFELLTLTGWAPDASQPQPLRPGSAQVSLADVLKKS